MSLKILNFPQCIRPSTPKSSLHDNVVAVAQQSRGIQPQPEQQEQQQQQHGKRRCSGREVRARAPPPLCPLVPATPPTYCAAAFTRANITVANAPTSSSWAACHLLDRDDGASHHRLLSRKQCSFAQEIKSGVDFQGQPCGQQQFVYFRTSRPTRTLVLCEGMSSKRWRDHDCPFTFGDGKKCQWIARNARSTVHVVRYTSVGVRVCTNRRWWSDNSDKRCGDTDTFVVGAVNSEQVMIRQLQDTLGRFVGALGNGFRVLTLSVTVLAGVNDCTAISLSTAGLYLVLLRYCGCISVLLSTAAIESTLLSAVACGVRPASYANDPVMLSSLQISAVVMCCAAILFLLFAVVNMSRLLLAGAFISHAARALSQLKRLLVLPFISYVLLLLLFGWGILVTVCIFGAGETSSRIATISATSPSSIRVVTESFQVSTKLRWLFIYHLWGMYWSVNFLLSIGEMITATAMSLWYFSPENRITGLKEFEEADPVSYSAQTTIKYHLGTLALSSGSVAPVEHIRSFFLYLENKNEFDANALTEFAAKCCCCCIWCFKHCLKYICKEAVYVTAIQGTNFYTSGKMAYTLISSNLIRVGALSQIGHASVLLGKLIVCTTTGLIAWFLLFSLKMYVDTLHGRDPFACSTAGCHHALLLQRSARFYDDLRDVDQHAAHVLHTGREPARRSRQLGPRLGSAHSVGERSLAAQVANGFVGLRQRQILSNSVALHFDRLYMPFAATLWGNYYRTVALSMQVKEFFASTFPVSVAERTQLQTRHGYTRPRRALRPMHYIVLRMGFKVPASGRAAEAPAASGKHPGRAMAAAHSSALSSSPRTLQLPSTRRCYRIFASVAIAIIRGLYPTGRTLVTMHSAGLSRRDALIPVLHGLYSGRTLHVSLRVRLSSPQIVVFSKELCCLVNPLSSDTLLYLLYLPNIERTDSLL
ncbi:Choline transporter-like [Phytophthora cactorum]|nr:Choline transporter-like [Phytophthora cactorum]